MTKRSTLRTVGDGGRHRSQESAPKPLGDAFDWTLRIHGEVERPCTLSLEELWSLQVQVFEVDILCVSSGRIYEGKERKQKAIFTGISLQTLLEYVGLSKDQKGEYTAKTLVFKSRAPGFCGPLEIPHSTSLPLSTCLEPDRIILTGTLDGLPLAYQNGGPLRSVVQEHYFYKSVKWLNELYFSSEPPESIRGTWELHAGYHNIGRKKEKERFEPLLTIADADESDDSKRHEGKDEHSVLAALLKSGDASRLIAARLDLLVPDFHELPGWNADLQFVQRDTEGKPKYQAALRGTSFNRLDFRGWDMSHVNFSLSHFINATFSSEDGSQPADMSFCDFEGANFRGANLTNVNMEGAYLAGVVFSTKEDDPNPAKVKGLRLKGVGGLDQKTADWLTQHGALDAEPSFQVSEEKGGYLPRFVMTVVCLHRDVEKIRELVSSHFLHQNVSGDVQGVSFVAASEHSREEQTLVNSKKVELHFWIPPELRHSKEAFLQKLEELELEDLSFEGISLRPQWVYVPFARGGE